MTGASRRSHRASEFFTRIRRSLTYAIQATGTSARRTSHRGSLFFGERLRGAQPVAKKLGKALLVLLSALGGVSAILFIITSMSPKPDLQVGDISWSPQNPWPGQRVTISFQAENVGASDAGPFVAELRADGTVVSAFVPGIPRGSSEEVRLTWQPNLAGDTTVWVILDSGGVVAEADKDNNQRSAAIAVGQPPILLTPSGVRRALVRGEDVAFDFEVDWRGNPEQQIGFSILQSPGIENGGISVGSPIQSSDGTASHVACVLLTGEETPPGFYLVEVLAENKEGELLGTFQIELFVEAE